MPFVLLLCLALFSLQSRWPDPPFWLDSAGVLLFTFLTLLAFWLFVSRRTGHYCREFARDPVGKRGLIARFHSRQKNLLLILAACCFVEAYLFGWGAVVQAWWRDWLPSLPGVEVVLLAPLLVGLIASWARAYDFERLTHDLIAGTNARPFPSRWQYLTLQIRFNMLLVVLFLFCRVLERGVAVAFPGAEQSEDFLPLFLVSFLGLAFLSIPWLLRVFLGLTPLPKGPLRDRLEGTARRVGCRCSNILLWNTRQSMANAMVTGVLPWARYIVLTDLLIFDLSTEEVEAVLGHELGHVKHHHMLFYSLFLLASLLGLATIWQHCQAQLEQIDLVEFVPDLAPLLNRSVISAEVLTALLPVISGAIYLYVVFGMLSRFCERQADIFACRTVSTPAFINALEKVAAINGIHREKPGWLSTWRHPTIARRVDFLQRMQEDPQLEPRFQRRLGILKWSVTLGLFAIFVPEVWKVHGATVMTFLTGQP